MRDLFGEVRLTSRSFFPPFLPSSASTVDRVVSLNRPSVPFITFYFLFGSSFFLLRLFLGEKKNDQEKKRTSERGYLNQSSSQGE